MAVAATRSADADRSASPGLISSFRRSRIRLTPSRSRAPVRRRVDAQQRGQPAEALVEVGELDQVVAVPGEVVLAELVVAGGPHRQGSLAAEVRTAAVPRHA